MQNNFETQQVEFQKAMEAICLEMLHQGYEAMLLDQTYDIESEEDDITLQYILQMEKLELRHEYRITIIPQAPIYHKQHIEGSKKAKKAAKIDFKFSTWTLSNDREIHHFAEAKNLSEKNWKKANSKAVDANYYSNRYIETGISHLSSGYYPNTSFLVAYIVNGDKNNIIANLNKRIINDFSQSGYGKIVKPNESAADEYYISENIVGGKGIFIKHLFLQLYQITNV